MGSNVLTAYYKAHADDEWTEIGSQEIQLSGGIVTVARPSPLGTPAGTAARTTRRWDSRSRTPGTPRPACYGCRGDLARELPSTLERGLLYSNTHSLSGVKSNINVLFM